MWAYVVKESNDNVICFFDVYKSSFVRLKDILGSYFSLMDHK